VGGIFLGTSRRGSLPRSAERRRVGADAGFTLIETLVATALFLIVIGALATVTGQWLPSWNRGFARVQRTEQLALGVDRIMADLAAAEFISPNARLKRPIFDGTELSVTFVRSAVGPNAVPGLEFVRLQQIASDSGPVLARSTAPFVPLEPDMGAIAGLKFTDPVVLVRAPLRVTFAYAGADRAWLPSWLGADKLPSAVRVTVRDAVSGATLAVSSSATVHVELPAECVNSKNRICMTTANTANDADAPKAN
jgi:general secretion pathway protein J